jgi:hypothetical protein
MRVFIRTCLSLLVLNATVNSVRYLREKIPGAKALDGTWQQPPLQRRASKGI